jgi:large subunit ribosomal protein L9
MKVLLKKNISKLGKIGDVVDVKPGYARNYLIPMNLAGHPTRENLKAVEAEKQKYLQALASQKAEIQARAAAAEGKEISIHARANEEGHLYGSIGPAQVAAALAAEGIFVEPEDIVLDSPLRQLDKYDIVVRFAQDVTATIHVWVLRERDSDSNEPHAEETPVEPGEESS